MTNPKDQRDGLEKGLTNYGDIDQRIWVAVNNAARGQSVEAQLKTADDQVAKLLRQAGYPA